MKALIVGCGNIGSVAAEDLAESMKTTDIVVADYDKARAEAVAKKIAQDNVSSIQLDITKKESIKTLRDFDAVMGFLPGPLGYRLAEECIEAGKDLVDVSFMAENSLTLNDRAAKTCVTIVPDCGLAPGISNLLVGHAAANLDKVKTVHIMVGGLPEKPIPPVGYVITWSPESLIDEYTRKAGIVRKGKRTQVEVFSELEEIDFPRVGKLEAFLTDGLRTLSYTIPDAEEMWEKTLRYPGHAEKIRALKDLGFFDEEEVQVDGLRVSPRKLAARLLREKLWKPEVKDIVALKVEVSGVKNGKEKRFVYHLLDRFDEKRKVTAMARTTAYPASIAAQMILKKVLKQKGVVPTERIGMDSGLFEQMMAELEKRGVRISAEE
jgi:saccharopine dehydrogenase-like NADP-dependent oxidoreductase